MIAYLDSGFVLTLLVRAPGSSIGNALLREVEAPLSLNALHCLQVENFLIANKVSPDERRRTVGTQAEQTWYHWFSEGVFTEIEIDWAKAFALARAWNQQAKLQPSLPLLLLHPALALLAESTHFLSFDPRSRTVAQFVGLKVLPERL